MQILFHSFLIWHITEVYRLHMLTKHLVIQLSYTSNHIISSADFYNIIFIKLVAHYINIMPIGRWQLCNNIILIISAAHAFVWVAATFCSKSSHVVYIKKYNISLTHISIQTKSSDKSIWVVMVNSTHTFFYIVCFAVGVDTFKEDCCSFIATTCLSCKLITWLVANRTLNFCVWFHLLLCCCNTFIFYNILLKIFVNELLYFTIIWHCLIYTKKLFCHSLCSYLTSTYTKLNISY